MKLKFNAYTNNTVGMQYNVGILPESGDIKWEVVGERWSYRPNGITTLLQYTTVNDKDNREIYNGDQFRWLSDYDVIKTIEWEQGSFFLGDEHLIDINWSDWEYCGNKYEKF